MKTLIITILASALLTACSVEPKEVFTANGQKGFSVGCSGNYQTMAGCYEQAGEKCGKRGFKILEKNVDKGSTLSSNKKSTYASTIINRSMIIQCK
jgi:hypothetical protein